MSRQWLTVSLEELRYRVRRRLAGIEDESQIPEAVVWTDGAAEVLVISSRLQLRLANGWLLAQLPLETSETGAGEIRAVFFLGQIGNGDGPRASFTLDPASHPELAQRWGDSFRNALWNGVLDVVEGAVGHAEQITQRSVSLLGFACNGRGLHVQVEV